MQKHGIYSKVKDNYFDRSVRFIVRLKADNEPKSVLGDKLCLVRSLLNAADVIHCIAL